MARFASSRHYSTPRRNISVGGRAGVFRRQLTGTVLRSVRRSLPPSKPPVIWQSFEDHFDGPAGSPPDPANWEIQTGTGAIWGNNELQYYRAENAALDGNGNLVITAKQEAFGGASYTSARIRSLGKVERTYGRWEARIKLVNVSEGMLPAFWMMADEATYGTWPRNGEIDIMEMVDGRSPVYGTVHGPTVADPATRWSTQVRRSVTADGQFHTYAVEWEPGALHWYVDDSYIGSVTKDGTSAANSWVFDDRPFHALLNVAVGGNWPGSPDSTSTFPAQMVVDYVRITQPVISPRAFPKIETLSEPFDTLRTDRITATAGVTVSGGQLSIPTLNSYPIARFEDVYDLTDSEVSVELVSAPTGGTSVETYLQVDDPTGRTLALGVTNGTGTVLRAPAGFGGDTFGSATGVRWLRLREAAGTLYWETSPDRTTWTVQRSMATPFPVTAVQVRFASGFWDATQTGAKTPAVYDNLNVQAQQLTRSAASAAGATDTTSWTLAAGRSATSTAGAADTATPSLAAGRTATSSAATADSSTWTVAAGRTATSSAGASDTASRALDAGRAASSTAGAADSHTWTAAVARDATSVAGATDSVTWTLTRDLQTSGTSTAGTADSHTWTVDAARSTTSAAGASDTASPSLAAGRTATSTAATGDSHTWTAELGRAAVDTAGATDSVSTSLAAGRAATSSAGASDSVAVAVDYVRTAVSGAGATDFASTEAAAVVDRSATSAAGATDTVSASLALGRSTASTAGAVDSVAVAVDYVRTATSGAGATDTADVSLAATRTATSAAGAVDTADASLAVTRAATSTAGTADAAGWTAAMGRTATSSAGASDLVAVQFEGQVSATATSSAGATDSVTVARDIRRTATSGAGAVDAVSITTAIPYDRSASSTVGATDAATVQLDAGRDAVSAAGASDTVTWEMARGITRTATSGAGATDTVTAVRDMQRVATSAAGTADTAIAGTGLTVLATSVAGAVDWVTWRLSKFLGAYRVDYGEPRTSSTGRIGRIRRPRLDQPDEIRTIRTDGDLRYGHTQERE